MSQVNTTLDGTLANPSSGKKTEFEYNFMVPAYLYRGALTAVDATFSPINSFRLSGERIARHTLRVTFLFDEAVVLDLSDIFAGTPNPSIVGQAALVHLNEIVGLTAPVATHDYSGSLAVPSIWTLMGAMQYGEQNQTFVFTDLPPGEYKIVMADVFDGTDVDIILQHTQ